MVFEVGIGTSQDWNPEKAAEEVITQALSKLSKPPTFVLLFSTIHYEKNKGFQKILDTIYAKIPKETPLIGGTVVGFMNKTGVYTWGITALTCYSDSIDVNVGFGEKTKRDPENAAKKCAALIKKNQKRDNYINSFLFENTSNGTVPKIPLIGQKKVMLIPFSSLAVKVLHLFNTLFEYGVGREDEVLEALSNEFPNHKILAASNYDDFKAFTNYQFYNDKILNNSVSAIELKTNMNIEMNSTFGLNPTEKTFNIGKKSFHDCLFGAIDGKPATMEFLDKLGWPESFLTETLYKKTNYYPVGYSEGETVFPHVVGLVIGQSLCFTYKFKKDELRIYNTSGKDLLNAVVTNISKFETKKDKIKFSLIVECAIRLETLGRKCYKIHEILNNFFKDTPFLLIYGAGEGVYIPKNKPAYFNLSFNIATFSD